MFSRAGCTREDHRFGEHTCHSIELNFRKDDAAFGREGGKGDGGVAGLLNRVFQTLPLRRGRAHATSAGEVVFVRRMEIAQPPRKPSRQPTPSFINARCTPHRRGVLNPSTIPPTLSIFALPFKMLKC